MTFSATTILAVELMTKGTERIRLGVLPDVKRKSLKSFIENNIEKDSEIITDSWEAYKNITGYIHTISNDIVNSYNEEILSNVHRVASLLKRWLLGTHQKYLVGNNSQHYLDEFSSRYNRRKSLSRGLFF